MSTSVLVNGTHRAFFSSPCGLRHGYPLPPLLFVIVLEALSKMISALVNDGLWMDFSKGMWKDFLSHTFLFVNNLLIFSEANLEHLHSVSFD